MRITCLGTGSPEANTKRASTGFMVEVGQDVILFDCGGGVFDRLLQAGKLPSDVTHIFFSHLHSDHMMDYARLVHAAWDEGGAPIQVVGPAPIATITDRFFGRDGALATDLIARTENAGSQEVWVNRGGTLPRPWPAPDVTEVTPGFTWRGDGWTITSCEAAHAQPELTCMALRIEAGGKSFVFSGDSGLVPALESLSKDADLLIHWCYRMIGDNPGPTISKLSPDAAQIAEMAARAGVKRLLVSHLRVAMDTDENLAAMRAAMAGHHRNAGIAEDLLVIDL